jgi:hypothetical protein
MKPRKIGIGGQSKERSAIGSGTPASEQTVNAKAETADA